MWWHVSHLRDVSLLFLILVGEQVLVFVTIAYLNYIIRVLFAIEIFMAFDGATPDNKPLAPVLERRGSEVPSASPESLEGESGQLLEELKADKAESAAVRTMADTVIADQRDVVPEAAAATAPDLAELEAQKAKLAKLEELQAQKARELSEVVRFRDEASAEARPSFTGGGLYGELTAEDLLSDLGDEGEAGADSEGGEGAEDPLVRLKERLTLEGEKLAVLERGRQEYRERLEFFKEFIALVVAAKQESAPGEVPEDKREALVAHCQKYDGNEVFFQEATKLAGDEKRTIEEVMNGEEFVDAMCDQSEDQLQSGAETVEKILSEDALGKTIEAAKKRIERYEQRMDKLIRASEEGDHEQVSQEVTPSDAAEAGDEADDTEEGES